MKNVLRLSTSRNIDVFLSEKLNVSEDAIPITMASKKERSVSPLIQISEDIKIAIMEITKFKVLNSFINRSFRPGLL